jgi:hypothetical protein
MKSPGTERRFAATRQRLTHLSYGTAPRYTRTVYVDETFKLFLHADWLVVLQIHSAIFSLSMITSRTVKAAPTGNATNIRLDSWLNYRHA